MKLIRIEPNRLKHVSEGFAVDHLLDYVAVLADVDMSFVRSSKKVVIVAHHLLISSHEHYGEIVRLVRAELMKFEHRLDVVEVDELVHDAVRIACNIT